MKTFFIAFILGFTSFLVFPQLAPNQRGLGTVISSSSYTNINIFEVEKTNNYVNRIHKKSTNFEGSVFLFKNWQNKGTLTKNNKIYSLSNINYNVQKDVFMAELSKDSILVLELNNINNIIINDKKFIEIYNIDENKKKVFELIHGNKNFRILKKYYIRVIEKSQNPMLNRTKTKVKIVNSYYKYIGGVFYPFKFNRKYILSLFDIKKHKDIQNYVKKNKFSYKKYQDMQKTLNYFALNKTDLNEGIVN